MKVDIDPQTESRLREIAACGNASPEALAAEILAAQIQDRGQARYWQERAEDMAALEAMKKGEYISQEEMFAKLDQMAIEARKLAENGR